MNTLKKKQPRIQVYTVLNRVPQIMVCAGGMSWQSAGRAAMVKESSTDWAQMGGQDPGQAQERMKVCPGGGDDTK